MTARRSKQTGNGQTGSRHVVLALSLAGLAAGMVGMSFAAVPLYRIFCQVTGYAGTTQRAEAESHTTVDRKITVRFDGNVSRDMPWRFQPEQREITLKLGENALAFYKATNPTKYAITGTATFNVTPEIMGSYFSKIQCFCFTEQKLEGGQSVDMPVTFYVDPEMLKDPDARDITEITLSYTFFPVQEPVAAAPAAARGSGS